MNINFEELKALVEAGDKSSIEKHIKEKVLEKGDVEAAAETNPLVKSELDSLNDKYHAKALNTWKENNLKTLVDEEVSKRNPQETPEQKRIRELEEKIAEKDKAEQRTKLKEAALAYATGKGYDAKFATKYVERFLGDDEATTHAALDEFKTDFDAFVQVQVEEKLKGSKRNPGGNGEGGSGELSYGAKLAQNTIESEKAAGQTNYFE